MCRHFRGSWQKMPVCGSCRDPKQNARRRHRGTGLGRPVGPLRATHLAQSMLPRLRCKGPSLDAKVEDSTLTQKAAGGWLELADHLSGQCALWFKPSTSLARQTKAEQCPNMSVLYEANISESQKPLPRGSLYGRR